MLAVGCSKKYLSRFSVGKSLLHAPVSRLFSEGDALQKAFIRSVAKSGSSAKLDSVESSLSKPTSPLEAAKAVLFSDRKQASAVPNIPKSEARKQPSLHEYAPRIKVIGVGGGGCNAVNNMINRGLTGVDFICANTDAQHLLSTQAEHKLQLGKSTTGGLGCGANPEGGRVAAEESREDIIEIIKDADLVFITAGMGGGTGTGAAPVIAEICAEHNILSIAVVTYPFTFEGKHRHRLASEGARLLLERVDTIIEISNQKLLEHLDENVLLTDSFVFANDVLLAGVKNITDLMTRPGLVNLDFADVKAVMKGMGHALMGTGQVEKKTHNSHLHSHSNTGMSTHGVQKPNLTAAQRAADEALNNPLLGGDMNAVHTAKGMIVNVCGGPDLTLHDVGQAVTYISDRIQDENAKIIFGASVDPTMEGLIRVSIVATGLEKNA